MLTSPEIAFWRAYERVEMQNLLDVLLALLGGEPEPDPLRPMAPEVIADNFRLWKAARHGDGSAT